MKNLTPNDFICIDEYQDTYPIIVQCDYARDDNLLFGERIYRHDAKIWAYKSLAHITFNAAEALHKQSGSKIIVYDCLRTTTAQEKMLQTQRVKNNPHWLEEPRLLSPPGSGAHPRGMAIDVSIVNSQGVLLDMGTAFDYLAENSSPEHNPAHREYIYLKDYIRQNRNILDTAMRDSAQSMELELFALPQEWWDFRLILSYTNRFAPLSDNDLPEYMRCCD